MLPIFRSHFSLGSSVLTLEPEEEIKSNSPVSIFAIAKKHGLKEVYLAEKSMTGFLQAVKGADKMGVALRFGIDLIVTGNIANKNAESLQGDHKVTVWLTEMSAYKNLCRLVTVANTEGFYYYPRIDEAHLEKFLGDGLILSIPFYDSFIAKNLLTFSTCVFNYEKFNPTFCRTQNLLPFDPLIAAKLESVVKPESIIDIKSVYYYNRADFEAYVTMRCIGHKRRDSCWDSPRLDHFSSQEFCFESFLENQ